MTTQPERLHHLLDRLLRGVLLPEEREQLAELVRELEADNHRYEEVVVGELNEANIGLQRQAATAEARVRELEADMRTLRDAHGAVTGQCRAAEHRTRELEAVVARVTQAVDGGPVGARCERIIRAALTPPTGLCGCGRPDPGPCTPCPTGSPSLHCACTCTPAKKTTS